MNEIEKEAIVAAEMKALTADLVASMRETRSLVDDVVATGELPHAALHTFVLRVAARIFARPRPLILDEVTLLIDVVQHRVEKSVVIFCPGCAPAGAEAPAAEQMHPIARKLGDLVATIAIATEVDPFALRRRVRVQIDTSLGTFYRETTLAPLRADRTGVIAPDRWHEQPAPVSSPTSGTDPAIPLVRRTSGSSMIN